MADDTGDLLMMIMPFRKTWIDGESSSTLTSTSPLLNGFTQDSKSKISSFFEISNFKFEVQSLRDDDTDKRLKEAAAVIGGAAAPAAGAGAGKPHPNFRTLKTGEAQSCPMQPVTFSRPIDRASPILLSYFVQSTTMYGAAVVKRKPAGGPLAGEPFLRLEFIGVLFTDIQWSNEDPVTENCTFIARAVNVMYKPQLPDGSLGATRNGFWSRIPNKSEELSC